MAAATTVSWCQLMTTPATDTLCVGKNCGTNRGWLGSHTIFAIPMSSTSRPTVTVSDVSSDDDSMRRMSSRSMRRPSAGATTSTTAAKARPLGQ